MIHGVTHKADLPAKTSHRSEPAAATEVRSHAVKEHSDSETPADVQPERATLEEAVSKIRNVLRSADSHLEIEIDPDLQRVIVKIVNGDSNEVIRQIPAQAILDLAKSLPDFKGLLLRQQA